LKVNVTLCHCLNSPDMAGAACWAAAMRIGMAPMLHIAVAIAMAPMAPQRFVVKITAMLL
jgi:hypothetical protein